MTDQENLRALVLDAALAQALRVVDVVREQGLSGGSISDTINIAGSEWHLNTTYVLDQDAVRVSGHPAPNAEAEVIRSIAAAFGVGPGTGQFDWSLPAAWVEAAGRPTTTGS